MAAAVFSTDARDRVLIIPEEILVHAIFSCTATKRSEYCMYLLRDI